MDEIINIQQNHNDGGSLLGKEGLIQLWKMINDKFVTTDCTGLLWSKDVDHAFVDNISSRLDGSKVTLTLPTYNLYTKTIGSVSTVFDIGSIPSIATKADLSQCVKKSIIVSGSGQALTILDTSALTDGILSFRGGADSGALGLYFYGSTDGETQIRIGYRATTTIPAVSSSQSGLMTPDMLNKLNGISGGGGPVSKDDVDKSFVIGDNISSNKSGDNVTLTFPTYNPKTKSTSNSTVTFPVGSSMIGGGGPASQDDLDHLFIDGLDASKSGDMVTLTATTYNLRTKSRGSSISKSFQVGSTQSGPSSMATLTIQKNGSTIGTYDGSIDKIININTSESTGGMSQADADDRYVRIDKTENQTMAGPLTSPAFYMTSDIALRRDIVDTPMPDKIASRMIQFKQFKYKQDDDLHYGVIAQEVQKILPQLVHDNDGTKIVDYISLLCLKIQDLQDQINELKDEVSQ